MSGEGPSALRWLRTDRCWSVTTARILSGASVTPALKVSRVFTIQAKQARVQRVDQNKLVFSLVAALGLCAFQFGDRYGLNNMLFAQVQPMVSDLAKARNMAKQGNVDLLEGQTMPGQSASLRGEVTDANCYLGSHTHAYDHAFCAKLCAAAGSPLVFVPDQGRQIYLVLNVQNGVRLPENVLDRIGVPGIVVRGKVLDTDGLRALAIEALVQ